MIFIFYNYIYLKNQQCKAIYQILSNSYSKNAHIYLWSWIDLKLHRMIRTLLESQTSHKSAKNQVRLHEFL